MPSIAARTAAEQRRLDRLKIDAPFIDCQACGGSGWKHGFLCGECGGCGRMYFDKTWSVREWWERLPMWKRLNLIFMGVFAACIILALGIVGVIDKLWPYRP